MSIHDVSAWWQVCDAHWTELVELMERFLPLDESYLVGLRYTNRDNVMFLYGMRDGRLVTWLERTWQAAPDERWIHDLPGWGVLCDLCSEAWVFEVEREP